MLNKIYLFLLHARHILAKVINFSCICLSQIIVSFASCYTIFFTVRSFLLIFIVYAMFRTSLKNHMREITIFLLSTLSEIDILCFQAILSFSFFSIFYFFSLSLLFVWLLFLNILSEQRSIRPPPVRTIKYAGEIVLGYIPFTIFSLLKLKLNICLFCCIVTQVVAP